MRAEKDLDRFEELVIRGLQDDPEFRGELPYLIRDLPPKDWRRLELIVKSGDFGVQEAADQLREVLGTRGPGLRDAREAALYALNKILPPEECCELLISTLGDGDWSVAEDAALLLGASNDPDIVPHLHRWLETRLKAPRSRTQAHLTAEAIAACMRLANDAGRLLIEDLLAEVELTKLETMAWRRAYLGQAFSPRYPEIVWPA